ncbi:MAG TPA: hypothetical protein PLV68_13980, partial [Ilumatobacteraceae bacterium]|nr:hypothetical protein [Ilumatobacteraceae bacterium]
IACMLVGQRGMRAKRFGIWLSAGIAFRLAWLWVAGKAFEEPLKAVLRFIEKYQWWLVAAFLLLSVAQSMRKTARSPAPDVTDLSDATDLTEPGGDDVG